MTPLPKTPHKSRAAESLERIEIKSRDELRSWLAMNYGRKTSIWCVTWKKRPNAAHVPYEEVVEEALCFGWIDSLPRAMDELRSMVLLSPRKANSNWSKLNKERAERLIARGLMTPPGLAAIEIAKANGRWNALNDVDALIVPRDLESAMSEISLARQHWDAFPPSARRGILEWIKNAKTPETRSRRIAETVALAGKNVRANQYRQKLPGKLA